MFDSLQPHALYSPWNFRGQNTGVGSRSFLQEVFPTQRSNMGLLHCRQILYCLSHQFSSVAQLYLTLCDPMHYTVHGILQAGIPEWVAFPFSRGSSQPTGRTQVSWRRELLLRYSGLGNSMDCIVHGVAKSWTQLSNLHFHFSGCKGYFIWLEFPKQLMILTVIFMAYWPFIDLPWRNAC